jgi:hypothetical protein
LPFEPPAYSGGEHDDWSDDDQGSDSWADQFDWFSEHVSEITGIPEDVLRERDDFLEDYERAFGLEQGDMALHGFTWDDPKAYAEFLADWMDYEHDDIDYWLGYSDEPG